MQFVTKLYLIVWSIVSVSTYSAEFTASANNRRELLEIDSVRTCYDQFGPRADCQNEFIACMKKARNFEDEECQLQRTKCIEKVNEVAGKDPCVIQ